jgi:putative addiction module component (TIGR02574 family)
LQKQHPAVMTTDLLKRATKLSIPDRIRLVEDIWDSISDEAENTGLTEPQKRELDRRLEEMRQNPKRGISWEEAKVRILKRK